MRPSPTALWTGIVMMATLSGAALGAWNYARAQARADLASETALAGKLVAGRVRGCVTTRIQLVDSLSREWTSGGLQTEEAFAARAEALIGSLPGYQAVNRIDEQGVIVQVYPVSGNESALGKNLAQNPLAAPALSLAGETRQPQITESLQLYQGGAGFAGYFPLIRRDGSSGGYFNAVFRGQEIVDACLADLVAGEFAVALRDEVGPLAVPKVTTDETLWNEHPLEVLGRPWTLSIAPQEDVLRRRSGPGRLTLLGWLAMAAGASLALAWVRGVVLRRRQQEQQSREEVRRLAALVESSRDAIVLVDLDFRVLYKNRATDALAGANPGAGDCALEQLPLPTDELRAHLVRVKQSGAEQLELYEEGSATMFAIDSFVVTQPDSHEPMALAISISDVSARHRLDGELQQARKMEAIGRLAGGVAHDFNNLLTVMVTNVVSLREQYRETESLELLDEIDQASRRAADLTRQLLSLGKTQARGFSAMDVGGIVRELSPLMKRLLRDDVELLLSVEEDLPEIRGDRTRLEQIVLNLVMNAADAIEGPGLITVTVDEASGGLRLTVGDNGRGMSAEVARRAFEPFYTTKGLSSGTGLGLATVYAHVRSMEGTVAIESEPETGTIMVVRFPSLGSRTARTSRVNITQPEAPSAFAKLKVLFVEDDDLVRTSVGRTLATFGHKVTQAENGQQAIELLSDPTVEFDVVLTDAIMPKLGGEAVLDWIEKQRPALPVIIASGYSETVFDTAQLKRRGARFVQKPYEPSVLLAELADAVSAPRKATGSLRGLTEPPQGKAQ